jgi:uncharacterized metal-binding protein YceD (DUF177 family)
MEKHTERPKDANLTASQNTANKSEIPFEAYSSLIDLATSITDRLGLQMPFAVRKSRGSQSIQVVPKKIEVRWTKS